jgi:hypothetical protein
MYELTDHAFQQKMSKAAVFLDTEKAFDTNGTLASHINYPNCNFLPV